MKKAIFIGFAGLLVLSKILFGFIWQLHFYANQQTIIAQECINKNRPEMNCNGTCYLAKQLKKADLELEKKKEDQQRSLNQLKGIEVGEFLAQENEFLLILFSIISETNQATFGYSNTYNFQAESTIFHPPTGVFHS